MTLKDHQDFEQIGNSGFPRTEIDKFNRANNPGDNSTDKKSWWKIG